MTRLDLAAAVFDLESAEQFRELIAADPRLLEEATIRELDAAQEAPDFAEQYVRLQAMLREARVDPDDAWIRRREWLTQAERAGEELHRRLEAAERALDRGEPADALATADATVPVATEFGLGAGAVAIHECRGRALMRMPGDHGRNIDAAIDAFEHALRHAVAGDQAAGVLDNLGGAWAQRPRGDRGENLELAVAAQRQGLDELGVASPPETVAIAQTNLAATLVSRERGDREENLREAIELCHAALTFRSPSRNAVDWAYTQLNLAGAFENLANLAGGDKSDALAAFAEVVKHRDQVTEAWLLGTALVSIGRIHLDSAQPDVEEQIAAWDQNASGDSVHEAESLELARDYLQQGLILTRDAANPGLEGRALRDLATVYDLLGQSDEAAATASAAVDALSAVGAPRDVVEVAYRLARLRADAGDWPAAADAFTRAVTAAEAGLAARLDDGSREDEQRRWPSLHRRAAFALARDGQPVEAALALEAGRARALRSRMGDEQSGSLDQLPPDLRDAYESARARVAEAPLGPAGAAERRQLADAIAAIRDLPGLDDFGTRPRLAQLAAGAAPGFPLLYVNPTPYGTLLLMISADGEPKVRTRMLEGPTGLELYGQLMVGANLDDAQANDADTDGPSYLLAITGHGDESDYLQQAVAHTLDWVGEALACPIAEQLHEHDAHGVTLVLCGPLGAVPVGAAVWNEDDAERRLVDAFTVNYAPSGLVAAAARRRAGRANPTRQLLALGDPKRTLEAAGPEVRQIARSFAPDLNTVAVGEKATLGFVRAHASRATYVHFACHAAGGLFDQGDAVLELADDAVSTHDLTAISGLRPRLVVVSACQGAQSEIAGLPDEAMSIGAAFLAAGAACAIAALWSVHDAATALLMVRMYEFLDDGCAPSEALRLAQGWLRELTEEGRSAFETAHPLLRGELRRLGPKGDDAARLEPLTRLGATTRPFAHPDFWAAFVAVGA